MRELGAVVAELVARLARGATPLYDEKVSNEGGLSTGGEADSPPALGSEGGDAASKRKMQESFWQHQATFRSMID